MGKEPWLSVYLLFSCIFIWNAGATISKFRKNLKLTRNRIPVKMYFWNSKYYYIFVNETYCWKRGGKEKKIVGFFFLFLITLRGGSAVRISKFWKKKVRFALVCAQMRENSVNVQTKSWEWRMLASSRYSLLFLINVFANYKKKEIAESRVHWELSSFNLIGSFKLVRTLDIPSHHQQADRRTNIFHLLI